MNRDDLLKRVLSIVGIVILLVAAWWAGRTLLSDEARIQSFFQQFPFGLAAVFLIIGYVLSSFVILDLKDILKIVAAILFGAWWSTLFIWLAELINNAMLFHLSRRLGRAWIERKFHLGGKDVRWVEAMCGVWQIFVLRIIPAVPYRILDVAYGLTAVSFRRYFTVSAVASPLRIFWFQFILAGLGSAVFHPEKITEYLMAHPEALRLGAGYLVVSFLAAFLISRKSKC
ncbi:MAG: TVP38/TMEM64 family protein [Candidatus Omnitrophica bacterium]|nr:TVP38/TMEM64 family protein [Candidatus Omnitrophota bacterium]